MSLVQIILKLSSDGIDRSVFPVARASIYASTAVNLCALESCVQIVRVIQNSFSEVYAENI